MENRLCLLENDIKNLFEIQANCLVNMRDLIDNCIMEMRFVKNSTVFNSLSAMDIEKVLNLISIDNTIRVNTRSSYCSSLRTIVSKIPDVDKNSILFLLDVEKTTHFLDNFFENVNTRYLCMNVISYLLKKFCFPLDITKQYNDYFIKLKDIRGKIRRLNTATINNFDWCILFKKYHDKRDSLPEHLKLVAALYIERPPLRSEWARSVMITNDLDQYPNAIRLEGDKVEVKLTDFKNSRDHEQYRYEFPPGYMRDLVREQIELRGQDKTFLEYKERTLQLRIKELIRFLLGVENVGVQELRRSYETYLQSSNEYMSSNIEEQNRMHGELLHTYNVAREYRRIKRE